MARFTETRDVHDFSEIVIEGFGDAEVVQSDVESLEVEADEAVLERLKTEVRDGRLVLGLDLEWWEWLTYWATWMTISDKLVRYRISMKTFEGATIKGSGSVKAGPVSSETCRLRISGSGKLTFERLETIELHTQISGSGNVRLAGQAGRQEIHISGSGDVSAPDLETRETEIHISGAGKAIVNAVDSLYVHISGSGDVRYVGAPHIEQSIAGAGSVRPVKSQ
jgi:hypothetical protein